jgi:signal peptidase I
MAEVKGSRFGETVRTIIYAGAIAFGIRIFAFEPFSIPSESMLPTLLVGDYLFVSKFSYGYSRHSLPFSMLPVSGRFFESIPDRGDVTVFKLPGDNSKDYIKRIIGLPGDRIQMSNGVLHINGKAVDRKLVGTIQHQSRSGRLGSYQQYVETLPEGKTYKTLEMTDSGQTDNTQEFVVPKGHYFAMGDNRDNSLDSRIPSRNGGVGFVPVENLVGRAEILFFSTDGSARFWEIWQWFSAARIKRFFQLIE